MKITVTKDMDELQKFFSQPLSPDSEPDFEITEYLVSDDGEITIKQNKDMKTLKLKHSLASGGSLSPQQDAVPAGFENGVATLAVTGLPDEATHRDAMKIADSVMLPTWLDTIDASQAGKNLYRSENLTAEQLATVPDWYREKYC